MTKFDTSSFKPDGPEAEPRTSYEHPWQHALADIRETSVITWANKVVEARGFYDPRPTKEISWHQRNAWHKEAMRMARGSDPNATVGGWTIVECIQRARMTHEQMQADPQRPSRNPELVRQVLRELGNPNIPCFARDTWIKLGEQMLERVR